MAADSRAELLDRIEKYITPVITAFSSFFFFTLVPFLPGPPVLPALVAVALGYFSTRKPRGAALTFYMLVFVSEAWQMVGFGLFNLLQSPVGALVAFLVLAPFFVNFMNPRSSPSSLALTFLAVAVMLTPEFYLSVPLMAAAVVMDGLQSVAATASTFIFTLAPLLLIENALYYAAPGVSAAAPPLIFSQLTHVAQDIRPPLPGLNLFLTGIPSSFFSPNWPAVVNFLTTKAYIMLVPVIVFAILFSASVAIAGVLTSVRDRLLVFERVSMALKVTWPLVVTTVSSMIFAGLILVLSPNNLGGYQTQLARDPSHFQILGMLAGGLVFGGVISVNGYVNSSIRNAARAKESLISSLGKAEELIGGLVAVTARIGRMAPSVGLRVESSVLEEYSSHLSDIRRQMDSANEQAWSTWDGDVRIRIIPTLNSLPEQIRVKVVNELSSVVTMSASLNNTMEHVGATTTFPGEGYSVASMSTEDALDAYVRFTTDLESKVRELYSLYISAAKALDVLLDKTVSEPPVNPEVLMSTQDYITAMRLLAEDYSMTFHAEYKDELASQISDLVDRLRLLSRSVDTPEAKRLEHVFGDSPILPLDSPRVLKLVEGVVAALQGMVDGAVADAERLSGMVATLMPAAANVLKFESLAQLGSLKSLRAELKALRPTLASVTRLVMETRTALELYRQSEKNDEENLIVIAQYPLAQRLIKKMASTKSLVPVSELPFLPDAAHLFAKIFTASNPSARYDDQGEVLLMSHA